MKVKTVMKPEVKFAGIDASAADVARIMQRNDCGAVPIVNAENHVVGMVTDRDICLALAKRPLPAIVVPITDVMSRRVHACHLEDDVASALATMQKRKVRRLPVVDDDGGLVGILSIVDVVMQTEKRRGTTVQPTYGETVKTLKAISRRQESPRTLSLTH